MSKSLEEITPGSFWDFYCKTFPPPPGTPREEIEGAKMFYMSGLAAMLAFAQRLETETPERRTALLTGLHGQLVAMGAPNVSTMN